MTDHNQSPPTTTDQQKIERDNIGNQEQDGDEDLTVIDKGAEIVESVSPDKAPDTNTILQDTVERQRLHPFVHWAQSQTHISLRVDLIQAENLDVCIEQSGIGLKFFGRGKGAHGLQDYYFTLDFHSQVEEKFECHTIERYVLILIKKSHLQKNWPRLTKQPAKLPWLRVDFDRYTGDNSGEDSDAYEDSDNQLTKDEQTYELLRQRQRRLRQDDNNQQSSTQVNVGTDDQQQQECNLNNIFNNNSKVNFDIFNPFNKQTVKNRDSSTMKYDYRKGEVAVNISQNVKTYLFLYNLAMFVMFLKVYIVLIIKGLSGTIDDDVVQGAGFIIKLLTYTQLLEAIHPMLGFVPGGPFMPLLQAFGRLIVNHFLTEPNIRQDSAPYAHYLYMVWTTIEIFRYSYYTLHIFKRDIYALTWCRYSLFIPLYPLGGLCESMVVLSAVKHYEKTGQYSFSLSNISFSLPVALRIYIFLLLFPSIYILMKYMWGQRCRQLKEKVD